MKVPTGGKAHEPQGMIRCDSEADSTVWMKEDETRKQDVQDLFICSEMILSFQSFFYLLPNMSVLICLLN